MTTQTQKKYVIKSGSAYLKAWSSGQHFMTSDESEAKRMTYPEASRHADLLWGCGFDCEIMVLVQSKVKPEATMTKDQLEQFTIHLYRQCHYFAGRYQDLTEIEQDHWRKKAKSVLAYIDAHVISLGELEG